MNHLTLLWRQFLMEWKLYSRDRGAMFWTFLFPILMLFGFGLIFKGDSGPTLTLVRVAPLVETAQDQALVKALKDAHLNVVDLKEVEAEARWTKGETAAQLEAGAAGYRLRLNSYLMAQSQMTAQVVQQA